MKKEEAAKALTANMIALCGAEEGLRRGKTVIPAILNDFEKTLRNQNSDGLCEETYRLDDGSSAVHLTGRKVGEKRGEITEVYFNGRLIAASKV